LGKADVNDKTPDPAGGRFDRDAAGKLTGCVRELAKAPFDRKIVTNYTRSDRQEGVKIIAKMLARTGITSVHDTGGTPDDLRAYQDARESGPHSPFEPAS
jgi:predicted amidohydrolase YtcJ